MEIYLKRYFWLLPVVLVIGCAVLAAMAANHVIEAKYLIGTDAPRAATSHSKPVKHDDKPPPSKDAAELAARNMFCSTCDPVKPVETPVVPVAPVDENHPPITSLPLALLATIVSNNAHSSAATIANTQSFKSGSYSIGDTIPEVGEVRRIHPKSVDFWNKTANRLERVELAGTSSPAAPVAAAPPSPVAAAPPPPTEGPVTSNPDADLLAAVDKGVRRLDDTHYDIDRALVDKILTDPTAVARSARIVPSIKDGKPNGFKLYAIRPNSVFAKIGLQNGDTISGINGFDMSSPDKALEVYTKVRSASALSVSVLRRGQGVNMEYSIK